MIFLTLGTQHPFDRLVEAVDVWCRGRPDVVVFGQIPSPNRAQYTPKHFEWASKLDPADYNARFNAAPFVIAHAGMGSIITALSLGKPLIMMPRKAQYNEHRNDHQIATARRFQDTAGIHAAFTPDDLVVLLDQATDGKLCSNDNLMSPFAPDAFTAKLRNAILGTAGFASGIAAKHDDIQPTPSPRRRLASLISMRKSSIGI